MAAGAARRPSHQGSSSVAVWVTLPASYTPLVSPSIARPASPPYAVEDWDALTSTSSRSPSASISSTSARERMRCVPGARPDALRHRRADAGRGQRPDAEGGEHEVPAAAAGAAAR